MSELIEIQQPSSGESNYWQPIIGEETLHLLRSKGFEKPGGALIDAGERLLHSTLGIMQRCCDPTASQFSETGIVIGYVQSGKTLSFTLLTAVARDNGFQIVIVVAGTSVNLTKQSTERLKNDLGLETRRDRKWTLFSNPNPANQKDAIETALKQWADPSFPNDRCKTILITVMKNGTYLRNLTRLFKDLKLDQVPTLIIDDEGDQASLNNRASHAAQEGIAVEDMISEDEVSTIYRRLTDLRALFPLHTFLQYTATPQANLFINIMDRLSPNFIKLLRPGKEYTGGLQFFEEGSKLIIPIPIKDQIASGSSGEPPESLLQALRLFYLGVAAGEILKEQHNRTMLIHPSRLQEGQETYYYWVINITGYWKRVLTGKHDDEKEDLLADFRADYQNLKQTAGDRLPPVETLTGADLIHVIDYTPIKLVNASKGKTPEIPWQDNYALILIGGQAMDRGFTVEGLTVTYMPRDLGLSNVDTILQRARFFGYKKSYLGYCRVFVPQITIDAFKAIIEHEEDVRRRLEPFDQENKDLNDWDREVVLNQMLNLTRATILYDSIDHDRIENQWIRIKAPHDTKSLIDANRN